jgi:hypothetical protein
MDDRVIEPSEIIVEQGENPTYEDISHVNPWIRCIARFFDYSFFCTLLWATRYFFHGEFPFSKYEYFIPFEYFVWIPFEALLLCIFGTTPGKFVLGTEVRAQRSRKLSFSQAFHRSFAVWLRGMGMGVPFVNFFCLLTAYNKLKLFKISSWDRDLHLTVTHKPISMWRLYFAVFIAIVGLLLYYSSKNATLGV